MRNAQLTAVPAAHINAADQRTISLTTMYLTRQVHHHQAVHSRIAKPDVMMSCLLYAMCPAWALPFFFVSACPPTAEIMRSLCPATTLASRVASARRRGAGVAALLLLGGWGSCCLRALDSAFRSSRTWPSTSGRKLLHATNGVQ